MKIKPFKLLIMPQTTTKNVQTKVRIFSYIVKTSISIDLGQFMQAFQCMKDKGIIFIISKGKKESYSAANNIDNNPCIISGKSSTKSKTVKISTQKCFCTQKSNFSNKKNVSHPSERTDFLPKEKTSNIYLK